MFVDPRRRPTPLEETLRYLDHADDPLDAGHRRFLEDGLAPLLARLAPGACGLDYGSGRAGTLARLLGERGYPTRPYDPCFTPNDDLLRATYDFVTCTEVIEHFHEPRRELATVARLLRRDTEALLAVTTSLVTDDTDVARWWYARDVTHVAFYRRETLTWIAEHFGWHLAEFSSGGALFVSPPVPRSTATASRQH